MSDLSREHHIDNLKNTAFEQLGSAKASLEQIRNLPMPRNELTRDVQIAITDLEKLMAWVQVRIVQR